jgi:hypothetical protein
MKSSLPYVSGFRGEIPLFSKPFAAFYKLDTLLYAFLTKEARS